MAIPKKHKEYFERTLRIWGKEATRNLHNWIVKDKKPWHCSSHWFVYQGNP